MKAVLTVIILIAACLTAGYFGMPILIQKETSALRSDVSDIKQRLLKIEEYVKKEEEAKKAGQLPGDADIQRIVKTVNTILTKVASLEDSHNKDLSSIAETMKKQGVNTEEALRKQSENLDKSIKDIQSKLQRSAFNVAMATVRGNLLKVQVELKSKNVGTAKTEIDLINEIFEKTKVSAPEEQKKTMEEFQTSLKKTKEEMDTNLPAAIDRVDLLWHEMGKLIRK